MEGASPTAAKLEEPMPTLFPRFFFTTFLAAPVVPNSPPVDDDHATPDPTGRVAFDRDSRSFGGDGGGGGGSNDDVGGC